MKLVKLFAIAAIALGISACGLLQKGTTTENTQVTEPEATTTTATTSTGGSTINAANGIAAGKALLALYTQYKADGKLDLSNPTNLANIVSLINNLKGLRSDATVENTPSSFLQGLVTGSANLVTTGNTPSVLSTLGSISNLDVSALANSAVSQATSAATSAITSAASSAATSAITSALGGLTGTSSTATTATSAEQQEAAANAQSAMSALTSLFSMFK